MQRVQRIGRGYFEYIAEKLKKGTLVTTEFGQTAVNDIGVTRILVAYS